jgi:hypothetical protein
LPLQINSILKPKMHKYQKPKLLAQFPDSQRGAALIITLVVMLALTVVALGVTSSNQTQSIMVRNNQFRLEAFNVSYSEIDAQVDNINRRKLSDGVPNWLVRLIDGNKGTRAWYGAADADKQLPLRATNIASSFMERGVAQEYRGSCLVFGQQIGAGAEKIRCNELVIESEAEMKNTSVDSDQRQVYEYKTLNL